MSVKFYPISISLNGILGVVVITIGVIIGVVELWSDDKVTEVAKRSDKMPVVNQELVANFDTHWPHDRRRSVTEEHGDRVVVVCVPVCSNDWLLKWHQGDRTDVATRGLGVDADRSRSRRDHRDVGIRDVGITCYRSYLEAHLWNTNSQTTN